jgi:hypothetical protein
MKKMKGRWVFCVIAALCVSVAAFGQQNVPYNTGFEQTEPHPFYVGSLNGQNSWQVTTGTAAVQAAEKHAGAQAVSLNADSEVSVALNGTGYNDVWVEGYFKGEGSEGVPDLSKVPAASSFVYFSATDGVQALDGDGSGNGIFVNAGVAINSAQWYRITVRQDYGAKTWDLYVDGALKLSNLGFKDNSVTQLNGYINANYSASSTYLDDFRVSLIDPFENPLPLYVAAYRFDSDSDGWTTQGAAIVFGVPQFSWQDGAITITATNNTNNFGYWQSPAEIPIIADSLYRADYLVFTDVTDPLMVPQIRLRMNSSNLQVSDYLIVNSVGSGSLAPTDAGKDYYLYFVPPANDTTFLLACDLLNFDPTDAAQGMIGLEQVFVDRLPLDDLTTPTNAMSYMFVAGTDDWTTGGSPIVFSMPQAAYQSGALVLTSETNTNTFGFWQNDPADIIITPGVLYRGTFAVSTDLTDQSMVPEMRLRFNTTDLQASCILDVISAGDGGNSPSSTGSTYSLYFYPDVVAPSSGLIIAFDVLNFNPADAANASLMLDSVNIETFTGTILP